MRDIDLPVAGLARDIGCNEQSVRVLDQCAYAIVYRLLWNTWFGRRLRGITGEGELPHLDVPRTIAVALFDNQIEPFVISAADRPVQSIAAAGEQTDPQQPQAIAILHASIGRIARIARNADAQSMGAELLTISATRPGSTFCALLSSAISSAPTSVAGVYVVEHGLFSISLCKYFKRGSSPVVRTNEISVCIRNLHRRRLIQLTPAG
jgi:hypothetical protein